MAKRTRRRDQREEPPPRLDSIKDFIRTTTWERLGRYPGAERWRDRLPLLFGDSRGRSETHAQKEADEE